MRGTLTRTSIADACREAARRSLTGTIEVAGGDGTGRIVTRNGRVAWAQSPAPRSRLGDRLVNAALLTPEQLTQALEAQQAAAEHTKLGAHLVEQGLVSRNVIRVFVQEQILDAVLDLVRWRDGTFEFVPMEPLRERLPVDLAVDQLLVEVSRREGEWDQVQATIPDLDMVPDFVPGGSSAAASLEPDEFVVLTNVDGERSVRELAEDLGYGEFEAARIVYGLALLGVIDVGDDEPDASDVSDVSDGEGPVADRNGAAERTGEATVAGSVATDEAADATEVGAPTPEPLADVSDRATFGALLHELSEREPESDESAQREVDTPPLAADDVDETTPAAATPPSAPRSSEDVSEFLRELSRLAVDEGGDTPPERSSATPDDAVADDTDQPPGDQPPESGKRRRGLFGRGR